MAEDAVEDFLRLCQVDPEVAKELREAPKEVQRHVLARGELSHLDGEFSCCFCFGDLWEGSRS